MPDLFNLPVVIVASFTTWATCGAISNLENTARRLVQAPESVYRVRPSRADQAPAPTPGTANKFALVISATGMDSHYGSGVRQMAFSMDLKDCGFGVDTLTEKPADSLDWRSGKAMGLISTSTNFNIGFGGKRSGMNASRVKRLMHRYEHIYLFGWAWEVEYANTLETALKALESDPSLHSRVTLVMDDNPYHRCYGLHELDFCRKRAPTLLRRWLNVSSRAMAISQSDADELNRLKAHDGLSGPDFEAWPLRLEQVGNLFNRSQSRESESDDSSATYLTMVGNDHAENRRFVSELVTGGHLTDICNSTGAILARGGKYKFFQIYFVGTIARFLQITFPDEVAQLKQSCLRLRYEISMEQFEERILPNTVAILNPFLETVQSGISVKTFEAVAMGLPIVTSVAGFRGLEECGERLSQAGLLSTNTAAGFVDIIKNKLANPETSSTFVSTQRDIMRTCVTEQKRSEEGWCSRVE